MSHLHKRLGSSRYHEPIKRPFKSGLKSYFVFAFVDFKVNRHELIQYKVNGSGSNGHVIETQICDLPHGTASLSQLLISLAKDTVRITLSMQLKY